jgi:hypothetical protein
LSKLNPNLKAKLGLDKECWDAEQDICKRINEFNGDGLLELIQKIL